MGVGASVADRSSVRSLPRRASTVKFVKSIDGTGVLTAAEHKIFVDALATVNHGDNRLSCLGAVTREKWRAVRDKVHALRDCVQSKEEEDKTLRLVRRHAERWLPAEHEAMARAFASIGRGNNRLFGLDAVTLENWRAVRGKVNTTSVGEPIVAKTLHQVKQHALRYAIPFGFTESGNLPTTRLTGYVNGEEVSEEATPKGLRRLRSLLNSKRVCMHRVDRVCRRMRKARSCGTTSGSGNWTKEEHAAFCVACNAEGIDRVFGVASDSWRKVVVAVRSRTLAQVRNHAQGYFKRVGSKRVSNTFVEDVFVTGKGCSFFCSVAAAVRHSGDVKSVRAANLAFFPEADPYRPGEGILANEVVAGRALRNAVHDKMDPALNPKDWWKYHGVDPPWSRHVTMKRNNLTEATEAVAVVEARLPVGRTTTNEYYQKAVETRDVAQREFDSCVKRYFSEVAASVAGSTVSKAYGVWLAELHRFQAFVLGDEWRADQYDGARLVDVVFSMCPVLFVSVYDGYVTRNCSSGLVPSLGTWTQPGEHLNCPDECLQLRLHYDGQRIVPLCLREPKMEAVDDRVLELFQDIEGEMPPDAVFRDHSSYMWVPEDTNYRVNSSNSLKRRIDTNLPEHPPWKLWRARSGQYVEEICENNHPTLLHRVPSLVYPYLDVGPNQFSPDPCFGEQWKVIGFKNVDGATVPIKNEVELKQVLGYRLEEKVPDSVEPGRIFWEPQVLNRCGIHTLNHLFQGRVVDERYMAKVARTLEAAAQALVGGVAVVYPMSTGDGDYDLQVLNRVLEDAGCRGVVLRGDGDSVGHVDMKTWFQHYRQHLSEQQSRLGDSLEAFQLQQALAASLTASSLESDCAGERTSVVDQDREEVVRRFVVQVHQSLESDASVLGLIVRPSLRDHYYAIIRDSNTGQLLVLDSQRKPSAGDLALTPAGLSKCMFPGGVLATVKVVRLQQGSWTDATRTAVIGRLDAQRQIMNIAPLRSGHRPYSIADQYYGLKVLGEVQKVPLVLRRPNPRQISLVMRRCSRRVSETCRWSGGRGSLRAENRRVSMQKYRSVAGSGIVRESQKVVVPCLSDHPDVQQHLEMFYKEGGLSVHAPDENYLSELTSEEKAELLVDWKLEYDDRVRISTCACCGGRDCDARPMEETYVPLFEVADMFEVEQERYEYLLQEGGGLYHLVRDGGRYFHVVESGLKRFSADELEKYFPGNNGGGEDIDGGGGGDDAEAMRERDGVPLESEGSDRDTNGEEVGGGGSGDGDDDEAMHERTTDVLYAAICAKCKSSIALARKRAADAAADDGVHYPKNSMRRADWGKDPLQMPGLNLPKLSMLEAASISKYVASYDVVTVVAGGSKIRKLRSHVLSSPHDASQILATRCNESLPRTDIHEHISLAFVGTDSQRLAMLQDNLNKESGTNVQLQLDFGKVLQWLKFLKRVHPGYRSVSIPETEQEKARYAALLEKSRTAIVRGFVCDDSTSMRMQTIVHSDATADRDGRQVHGELRHVMRMANPVANATPDQTALLALYNMVRTGGIPDSTNSEDGGTESGSGEGDGGGSGGSGGGGVGLPERLLATMGPLGNEFDNNHEIIAGSYPTLFPLGLSKTDFRGTGTPNRTVVKLLLNWHDGRFARRESLMFQFFSQMMRHRVTSNVSAHLSGNKQCVDDLVAVLENPSFERDLTSEMRRLQAGEVVTAKGRNILKKVGRACKISGQRVAWTKAERAGTTAPIVALCQRFGSPSVFVTVSPPQFDSPLAIRLSLSGPDRMDEVDELGTTNSDWTVDFPELNDRVSRMVRNPVADAKTYERIINAFWSALLQCKPVGATKCTAYELEHKKRGAFGYMRSMFGITESRKFQKMGGEWLLDVVLLVLGCVVVLRCCSVAVADRRVERNLLLLSLLRTKRYIAHARGGVG